MKRLILSIGLIATGLIVGGLAIGQERAQVPSTADLTTPAPSQSENQWSPRRTVEADGKTVLVELFTSQGCNYCPTAQEVVLMMADRGFETDRVIPIAFHVDYFNRPWKDPFSSAQFTERERAYSRVAKKRDPAAKNLTFTPLLMVDGRYPMSGYSRRGVRQVWPPFQDRLERALKAPEDVALSLTIESAIAAPSHRSISVTTLALSSRLLHKTMLVEVAITEGPLTTHVPSGENAGATLVEHNIVREIRSERVSLSQSEPLTIAFDLEPNPSWNLDQTDVVVFIQDNETGYVYQTSAISWNPRSTAVSAR